MKKSKMSAKIVITHPTGNQNFRSVASALYKSGMLRELITTLSFKPDSLLMKMLPAKLRNNLLRRSYNIPDNLINSSFGKELFRLLTVKLGIKKFSTGEHAWVGVNSVYRTLDSHAAKRLKKLQNKYQDITGVYCYEDGALATFETAKQLGIKCIYDLPIAYWETGRQLMLEEARRLPQWAATLGGGITDSEEKLKRKTQELELADIIVCPGKFVMDSVPAWAKNKKIVMAPFGTPALGNTEVKVKTDFSGPLRVLFVGSMGQRKGLGDLFEAIKLLNRKDVELVVMGKLLAPESFYRTEFADFTLEPGRPHAQVLELMSTCDVFCLPSIVEGRALVMQEAMSQGLPVIITDNTGGADLVIEGETGFLVPIKSPEEIAKHIGWMADHRLETSQMGIKAKEHSKKYTWENYQSLILEGIKDIDS